MITCYFRELFSTLIYTELALCNFYHFPNSNSTLSHQSFSEAHSVLIESRIPTDRNYSTSFLFFPF